MGAQQLPSHSISEAAAPAHSVLGQLALEEPELERSLREGLSASEKRLRDCVSSAPDPRVAEIAAHLVAADSKRLRPLLVLLGAEFGEPWTGDVVLAAVVAELVHVASLYHDDVMDRAATRRGLPSANSLWGERLAVFGGDWLLARSTQLAAGLGQEALRLNAQTAGRLVSGQLLELTGPAPDEDAVSHYFQVTAGKTAALLSMSLGIGALQAGAPDHYARALREYGELLGTAFQIADDLLDLTAPAERTGKQQGKDLMVGVPSLPVLLARAEGGAEGCRDTPGDIELRELLREGPVSDPATHRRALELFRTSTALDRCRGIMHQRLAGARAALAVLPPLPARRALDALCDYVAFHSN